MLVLFFFTLVIKHVYYNMSYACSLTIPFNVLSNECFQFACTIASLPGAWKKWKGAPGTHCFACIKSLAIDDLHILLHYTKITHCKKLEVDLTLKRSSQLQSGFIQVQVVVHLLLYWFSVTPLVQWRFLPNRPEIVLQNEIHFVMAFLSQKGR